MTEKRPRMSIGQTMLWLSAGTIAYLFTQWLLSVAVVRLGNTQIAGDFALVLSSSNIFYVIAGFGMRSYQISDTRREHPTESYLASRLLTCLLALVSGTVFCLTSTFTPLQKGCFLLFLLFRASEGGMDVLHGTLQSQWRMDIAGRFLILRGVVELALFAAVLVLTQQLFWALAAMTLFSAAWVAWEYRTTRRLTGFAPRLILDRRTNAGLGKLLLACLPLLAGNLAYSLIFYEPRYHIERIYGGKTLGIYASIAAPALIMPMLASYIFTPYMPKMSELYQQGMTRELNRLFLRLYAMITGLSALILAAMALLGKWGLGIIFGAEIAGESALLLPIALSLVFVTYYYYLNAVITSMRKTHAIYFSAGIGVLTCFLASGPLVQRFGPNGASFALMLAQFLQVAFLTICYSALSRRPRL